LISLASATKIGVASAVRPSADSARAFQYRHAESSCSDGGIASMAASTSGHAPARSAARTRHARCASDNRALPDLAEPFRSERVELPRRMEGDPGVPVARSASESRFRCFSQAARTPAASVRAARSSA
jgi:hypothetical protein